MLRIASYSWVAVGLCLVACGDDSSSGGAGGDGGSGGSGAGTTDGGGGSTSDGGAPNTGGGPSGGSNAGGGDAGGGGGGACVEFGTTCDEGNDTCCDYAGETGVCFPFGMGPKCTIPCPADPADCPNNGAGCNNMTPSYCKAN